MAGQPPGTAGFVLDDVGDVDDLSDGELELLHEALGYPPGRSVASMRRQLHRHFHSADPPAGLPAPPTQAPLAAAVSGAPAA